MSNPSHTEVSIAAVEEALDGSSSASSDAKPADKPTPIWGYPATYFLMAINCIVFALSARHSALAYAWEHHIWSQMFTTMFDGDRVVRFGASDAVMVLNGDWWRLLTATFVHVNVLHLLINMWCLWNLGFFGEPLLGRSGFISVYILTGVAGNILSLTWSVFTKTDAIVAGASGAVFGIAGILIILLSNRSLKVPWEELRGLRLHVTIFALVNLVLGWAPLLLPYLSPAQLARMHLNLSTLPRVDNSAHLGGFLSGVALGLPLFSRMTSGRAPYRKRQRATYAVAALFLCLICYAVATFAEAQHLA